MVGDCIPVATEYYRMYYPYTSRVQSVIANDDTEARFYSTAALRPRKKESGFDGKFN